MSYLRGTSHPGADPAADRRSPAGRRGAGCCGQGARVSADCRAHRAPTAAAAERQPPVLPPEIPQVFLPGSTAAGAPAYRPVLLGLARVRYHDAKLGLDHQEEVALLASLDDLTVDWQRARAGRGGRSGARARARRRRDLRSLAGARRRPPRATPDGAGASASPSIATGGSSSGAARATKQVSRPGESEAEFRVRLAEAAREERDRAVEELRQPLRGAGGEAPGAAAAGRGADRAREVSGLGAESADRDLDGRRR